MDGMRDLLRSGLARALRDWQPLDRLVAAWPVAAGAAMAAHGTLTQFEDGILTVTVDDAVWLARMLPLRGTLASDLSRIAGTPVRELHFRSAARERRDSRRFVQSTPATARKGGGRP